MLLIKSGNIHDVMTNEVYVKDILVDNGKIIKIEDDIDNIYWLAKNYGIISHLGNNESKNYEIFRFYYLNRNFHLLKKNLKCNFLQQFLL